MEDMYNLETLKFMCKFKNKTLSTRQHLFKTIVHPVSNFYNYATRNLKKEVIIYPKSIKNLLKDQIKNVEQTPNSHGCSQDFWSGGGGGKPQIT